MEIENRLGFIIACVGGSEPIEINTPSSSLNFTKIMGLAVRLTSFLVAV